ncbi:MAG: pyridoxal-phosphate dependent enzyme [Acidimicrobiia bacterium]|nr:pyridoxal-phosphate dependent enzyme [Acidimicrobiia bacterium]
MLHLVSDESAPWHADRPSQTHSPFVTYDERFAWAAYAAAHGVSLDARRSLVEELDDAVAEVEGASAGRGDGSTGVGFRPTPLDRSDELSAALGFGPTGGVWVKYDSVNVAGSHKARHLFSILLHLRAAELIGHLPTRPPLAIASCGNAALAAAVLARAARWPIDVYVPEWLSEATGAQLSALGATVHRCARSDRDPVGDPAMLRFREAVEGGAIPFTVQGPENSLCLDGGRTIGWEIADQLTGSGAPRVDQIYAQIGGGAFATCLGRGLREAGLSPRLYAVQAEGCAPLARAWERASSLGGGLVVGDAALGRRWSMLMTTWDDPHSLADGILDDETYDWLGVFDAMRASGGAPVVAPESDIAEAHRLANEAGFDVSATGSAGLAGLLANRAAVAADDRVIVVFTGVAR